MSGEIEVVAPGYTFNEDSEEIVTLGKLNKIVRDMVLKIMAGAITSRELADGAISSDKLADEIAAQMAIPNGSITTAKLATGALDNSAAGRLKMGDGFLSADAGGQAKMADAFLSADAAGQAKMADGFLAANAAGQAKMADGFLSADAAGRAKMADAFLTAAKLVARAGLCTMAQRLAFHAYLSTPQVFPAAGQEMLVNLDAEKFDSGSCFSTTTHLYTPKVAGLYLVVGQIVTAAVELCRPAICCSSAQKAFGSLCDPWAGAPVLALLYMNGTTDAVSLTMTTYHPAQFVHGEVNGNCTFLMGVLLCNT